MTTVHEIIAGVRNYAGACLLDIAAYYQHFPMPTEARHAYGFKTTHGCFLLLTIPTGHSHATGVGQMVSKSLTIGLKQQTDVFLDNFRCCGTSCSAIANAKTILNRAKDIGITMNDEDNIQFQEAYTFLGIHCDHKSKTISLSDKSKLKLQQIKSFLESSYDNMTVEEMTSIIGFLIYASTVMSTNLAPYYYVFKLARRRLRSSMNKRDRIWPWQCAKQPWLRWVNALITAQPRTVLLDERPIDIVMFSDASLFGWGGYLIGDEGMQIVGDSWHPNDRHINELEAWAIQRVLESFATRIANKNIFLFVDNTSCIAAAENGRSKNFILNQLADWLQGFQQLHSCKITIHYINSVSNLADDPSRSQPNN